MRGSSVYLDEQDHDYVLRLSREMGVSCNEVHRRALIALRKSRHDYATPLHAMLLVAEELRVGLITRNEAVPRIRSLVQEMDAMRLEALLPQKQQEPHRDQQRQCEPAPG